ncbi:GlcNAc-PI de-N-acetylase [Geobacter sulfurreducens]|nr:GlcNAc-PI de-N-acetylase [Geobacter sulfurreducens]
MLSLKFDTIIDQPMKILCLGAHSDDIEIGCGGTLLRLLSENDNVQVNWVVFGSSGQRKDEAMTSACSFLSGAKSKEVIVESFKDGFFPYQGAEIKEFFEDMKRRVLPDLIFTHYRNDLHQDHRLISELTWNTFRDHLIFEYEIMKYDGDIGNPNFFVHLDRATCQKKIFTILTTFTSQAHHHWFTEDTFYSMLRIRGVECNAPESYAEGFYCRKASV